MQGIEDLGVGDSPRGWVTLFPAAVSAYRDLQALSSQGLADLLDCAPVLALLVYELGD